MRVPHQTQKTATTEFPIIIPDIHYHNIRHYTRRMESSKKYVVLGVKQFPSMPWIYPTPERLNGYIVVFCMRFIDMEIFQPLLAMRYTEHSEFNEVTAYLCQFWCAIIKDLQSLGITVLLSVSSVQKLFREVVEALCEYDFSTSIESIHYSVIPDKDIIHLFEINSVCFHLEQVIKNADLIYFVTGDVTIRRISWVIADIRDIRTVAQYYIKSKHASNEQVTIFKSNFYYMFDKIIESGLKYGKKLSEMPTHLFLSLCCSYMPIMYSINIFTPSDLINLFNSFRQLRLLLSTAYFASWPVTNYTLVKQGSLLTEIITNQYIAEFDIFKEFYLNAVHLVGYTEDLKEVTTNIGKWNKKLMMILNNCRRCEMTKLNMVMVDALYLSIEVKLENNFEAQLAMDQYMSADFDPSTISFKSNDIIEDAVSLSNSENNRIQSNQYSDISDDEATERKSSDKTVDIDNILEYIEANLNQNKENVPPTAIESRSSMPPVIFQRIFKNVIDSTFNPSQKKKKRKTANDREGYFKKRIKLEKNIEKPESEIPKTDLDNKEKVSGECQLFKNETVLNVLNESYQAAIDDGHTRHVDNNNANENCASTITRLEESSDSSDSSKLQELAEYSSNDITSNTPSSEQDGKESKLSDHESENQKKSVIAGSIEFSETNNKVATNDSSAKKPLADISNKAQLTTDNCKQESISSSDQMPTEENKENIENLLRPPLYCQANEPKCTCHKPSSSNTHCPLHFSHLESTNSEEAASITTDYDYFNSKSIVARLPELYNKLPCNVSRHWLLNAWLGTINSFLEIRDILIANNLNGICSECFTNYYIDEYMNTFERDCMGGEEQHISISKSKLLYTRYVNSILEQHLITY